MAGPPRTGAPQPNPYAGAPGAPIPNPYAYPPGAPAPNPYASPQGTPPRRILVLVGVTLGVAALGAAAVAGWLYLGRQGGPGPSGPAPRAESTQVRDTAAGFSVGIPVGWQVSPGESGYGTVYRPAGGDRSAGLQIIRATQDTLTACEVLGETTVELSKYDGYREISRERVGGDGCEQVYAFDDPASAEPPAHAIVRLVVAADDTRWVILVFGPDTDAPLVRRHLTTAVESFRVD
ncbi:hypothetical protein BGK67_20445 [Streptomyces subrutilus]|uniref:Serine/arginine repetitive matrix protein 2 n=1 Tax=Streptomyces subrutilus TaxID=36818 RepID=A0A1E5PVI6_9ACTN|nr:hypothetical protein BGK67_20445 [Streptomyces subrutilus]